MHDEKEELKKEFELERMILFSDAVFAIAITLLIIEIKFPEIEKDASSHDIFLAFKPVMVRFFGFILSFFFTGLMWSRHLQIFKFLLTYNSGVIFRNLLFLFFIVCFPFSASGITEYIRPGYFLPIIIYLVNIDCITVAQFFLCYYLFKSRPDLCTAGMEQDKKYMLMRSQFAATILSITAGLMIVLSLVFGSRSEYVIYGYYVLPVLLLIMRRTLKKYKPVKQKLKFPAVKPSGDSAAGLEKTQ